MLTPDIAWHLNTTVYEWRHKCGPAAHNGQRSLSGKGEESERIHGEISGSGGPGELVMSKIGPKRQLGDGVSVRV